MKKIKKILIALLFVIPGCGTAHAEGDQPRLFIPEPEFNMDDSYGDYDTVPVKMMVKPALKPAQINTVLVKTETVTKPAQTPVVVYTPPKTKDTALIRRLYEGFKPKSYIPAEEKTKIKQIIDSVVAKGNPSTGNADYDYQTLVRIIDSLLKANNSKDSLLRATDTSLTKATDTTINDIRETKNGRRNFFQNYWWLIAAVLAAGALFLFMRKRKAGKTKDPKIFFSYAWDQDEALVMQLYSSLKKDGFSVIKDKENMGYKGVISKFMNEIGSANYVVVAISDKYLKSKFCMYELYEIYKNSGMNRDVFGRKLFPIRIEEELNLGDPDTVNSYVKYWKEQEESWAKRVKEDSENITEEQARQYQFIRRLVIDVSNLLSCLADINSLNLNVLKSNDFADIKDALRNAIEAEG